MKKNFNQGFLLVETLVVSTFCLTVLVILFLQFKNLITNYNTSFKYNTVEDVYNLNTIKKCIQSNNIRLNPPTYVYNGNAYAPAYDKSFCQNLVNAADIKILIYVNPGATTNCDNQLSVGLCKFISKLKTDATKQNRLIAEFNNGTYASITY